jgi:hypothetical protein
MREGIARKEKVYLVNSVIPANSIIPAKAGTYSDVQLNLLYLMENYFTKLSLV